MRPYIIVYQVRRKNGNNMVKNIATYRDIGRNRNTPCIELMKTYYKYGTKSHKAKGKRQRGVTLNRGFEVGATIKLLVIRKCADHIGRAV
jgi:hypothetical protein